MTSKTDELNCKLCDNEIRECEKFDGVVILDEKYYFHYTCGHNVIRNHIDIERALHS